MYHISPLLAQAEFLRALLPLGGTFLFSFRFFGGPNPGHDSCSGQIPVESSHNIPDFPPFLRAGTLLP